MKGGGENRATLINMLSGLALQASMIISGLVIPRLILYHFGSTANGLVASIEQYLKYIALAEGGITAVATASLYQPLVRKDYGKMSSVMATTRRFYIRISGVFLLCSLALAALYPLAMGTEYTYTAVLVLILAAVHMSRYLLSMAWQVLMTADQKRYIVLLIQAGLTLLGVGLAALSVLVYPSVHLIVGLSGALFLLQPAIYAAYVRKHYPLDRGAAQDWELLKKRWSGLAIHIAAFVHNSTDIVILTIFAGLPAVSVYSVYALAAIGLKTVITSLTDGINPAIGQAYARGDSRELNEKLDLYEYIVFLLTGVLFSIGALLITPFAELYTRGITDADYHQPVFGLLLLLAEALYLVKLPHLNLAYAANRFKEITVPAWIEAALNITVSLILVRFLGLCGAAAGTALAMLYRMVFHVNYTEKLIPGRKPSGFYRKLLLFSATGGAGALLCLWLLPPAGESVYAWILRAAAYGIVFSGLYGLLSVAAFRKEVRFLIRYLKRGGTEGNAENAHQEQSAPIDLVYQYVNGNDGKWLNRRREYALNEDNSECRFRDNGELRYSLRSVEKYTPWVRRIWIVTDSKPPEWLNTEHEKIRIVDHREIMPEVLLPCYNSNVIEGYLHRIPGLSEIFLYANDDMFFGNTVEPDFFVRNGKPVVRMMETDFDPEAPDSYYGRALSNAAQLIKEKYGTEYRIVPWHNVDVYTKQGMAACRQEFAEAFDRADRNRLRADSDIQRVIFHYRMIENDECTLKIYDRTSLFRTALWYLRAAMAPSRYFDAAMLALPDFRRMTVLRQLFRRKPKCVCLNETEATTEEDRAFYRQWMEKTFPEKCSMER